jgi:hypothetical protein
MAADVKQLCKRLGALKGLRAPHETVWRNCLEKTFPILSNGFGNTISDASAAQSKQARLLDGTGTDGARILASAIQSGSTPANSLWFQMYQAGSDDEGEVWLDESSHTLWTNIHAGSFDADAFEGAKFLVGAGWFVFYIDEAPEGGFQFQGWPISQCYISASREGGPIDTVFREYELTAEQVVNTYGAANVSKETHKLVFGTDGNGKGAKPDTKVRILRAIYPRTDGEPHALRAERLPIASCTVEVKGEHLLRESGYHEMPVIVPRWSRIPDSHYAVGPAFDALPDMNMLNETKAMELASLDLALCGMWIAEDDGVLNPRTVKVGPRKVIVANSVDSMKPLVSGADFNVAFTAEERLQAAVRKLFMADQLSPTDGPQMTAYEVHVRVNLIRQLLGPIYGRLQPEWLKPFVERCFGIAYRAGVFKPAPRSIAGRVVSIKYLSPLARAQSLEEVSAMDQFETVLMNESEMNPELADNYDWNEATRTRAKLLGVPARLIRTSDQVKQIRDERAEQQEADEAEALKAEMAVKAAPQIVEAAAA